MRALCLVLGVSAACTSTADTAPTSSLGGVAGIEEIDQGLADLSSQCTFDAGTGVMTLALEAGDIAWLSVGIGNTIEVNNIACGGATVATTKRIDVAEASSGDQTVIVDARTGSLGLGRATGIGLTVALGSGNDQFKLVGSNGADRIVVGASGIAFGADPYLDYTLSGVESVTINGDGGNDTISGAGDTVTGAAYRDPLLLYGGEGTDSLRGGASDDHCWGGDGDDTFLGGPAADGADIFTGGPGRDTADYSARTANLSLSLDDVANDGANAEGDNIESDVEVVKGGSGADTIAGGVNADTFYGGAGNDTVSGGGGADTLYGEAGDDVFVEAGTASGADTFIGGTGTDTIEYARTGGVTIALDGTATSGAPGEGDTIDPSVENAIGGAANDTLRGNTGANLLDGDGGNDTIFGGPGNDTLLGGSGINTLNGEAGDDRFPQGPSALGDDTIVGGAGLDTADYGERTDDLTVVCDATTASGSPGEGDRIGTDVEHVVGGGGHDTLIGNAGDNQLEGGAGVDALYGLAGDDVLDGGAGADALDCGAGDADIALDPTTTILLSCEL